ncbi:MAG: anthranilate phosphoribosyltransferase [Acidimicrobiia bacterium]|nr:MAG: anthranilate phosphoribosyltransferase [Acidimicrobiia bacterium]
MSDFQWQTVLGPLTNCEDIGRDQAGAAVGEIMAGAASPSQIAAFVAAMRTKRESAEEMAGMVDAMMDVAITVDVPGIVVDIVGTGGDGFGTFNISTTASFIAAGAGAKVAKHGNRAASSKTGSADLLESFGFDLELGPDQVAAMIDESGFGFFFAPRYHPAMRHVAPVRRELGIRTVFNFLGPLCNPAGARMSIGTSDPEMARLMVDVLAARGVDRAFVVYGEDGLDEVTTTAPTRIFRLAEGEITEAEFTPEDFGVSRASMSDLVGGDAEENMAITRAVLEGTEGARRDIALVNAAPAIVLAELATGFDDAMDIAAEAIDSGRAARALEDSLAFSRASAGSSR